MQPPEAHEDIQPAHRLAVMLRSLQSTGNTLFIPRSMPPDDNERGKLRHCMAVQAIWGTVGVGFRALPWGNSGWKVQSCSSRLHFTQTGITGEAYVIGMTRCQIAASTLQISRPILIMYVFNL